MSRDQDIGASPSSLWSNIHHGSPPGVSPESESPRFQQMYPPMPDDKNSNQYHSLDSNTPRAPGKPGFPTRSSTYGSPEPDRNLPANIYIPHARSEDLNHSSASNSQLAGFSASSPRPLPAFLSSASGSRPSTPGGSARPLLPSTSGHSEKLGHRLSATSLSSTHSSSSSHSNPGKAPPTASSTTGSLASTTCSACGKTMQGPFVRALGSVFHLNCFKCMDCGDVVASKFFPIEGPDNRQYPLCERDYFRRLNLICAQCGMALRGSYITACSKKFHVEHFTCSLCPTLFGPQDSYYEHDGDVYCHFHYSTRFATKCAGCSSAILKQFVEINRNMRDECWHPECYMINKFWNVKVVSRRPTSSASLEGEPEEPAYVEEEQRESPISLKDKQVRMEQQVYRIWTVLSAFEESSAACISDMLRQVSNGQYLDAIRMAEKFILHVEVLFATIDDLEYHFARLNMKGMSHVREARMLCRKTVELFTLLSHTQETGTRRMGMTQELLALVTGLAHYLKILIRIALTGALKLEREQSVREPMSSFLDKLHMLAVQRGNPAARRMIKQQNGEAMVPTSDGNYGTQGVTYGFRSLAPENAGESPFTVGPHREGAARISSTNPPSDLCVRCNLTVEEDCARLGTYQRWHSQCVQCAKCGKAAAVQAPREQVPKSGDEKEGKEMTSQELNPKPSTARRPPANVGLFLFDIDSMKDTTSFGEVPTVILCTEHAHERCRKGFQAVQRLEQYAFLLNVALRRLYLLLKKQGVVPLSPTVPTTPGQSNPSPDTDPYNMRVKSLHLDRKLSATARLPKKSTIIESPTGRSVQPSDVLNSQKVQEMVSSHPQHVAQALHGPQGQQAQMRYYENPTAGPPQGQSPPQSHQQTPPQSQTARLNLGKLPIDSNNHHHGHSPKPAFAQGNAEVKIIDDSAPNSPTVLDDVPTTSLDSRVPVVLSDIPEILEAAQAHEQRRSLPRQTSIPYIAGLNALELAIVKHSAVLALTRSPLKDQFDLDELLELVEVKKSGFWQKLFKAGDKKNVKKKGVFGVPLELLAEREGADSLLGANREVTMRIPSFIDDVISAMQMMDLSIEGIFRKNGNIRRLKDLTDAIDRDPSSVDLSQENPVQLAALLKKFLRDLPDPLMTYKLHRLFIATQSLPQEADRKRYLHLVSLLMPKSHRDTMEAIFVFLKWVASFAHMDAETGSKMDLGNLATVICPSILHARGRDPMRDETFGGLKVVTALLENQDEFFTVPPEFLSILHDQEYFASSMELPGKDFMKKCDTYMRFKASNGRPALGTPLNGSSNGSSPRPPINSPTSERPPTGPLLADRLIRQPHPGMPQTPAAHPIPGSPSPPQGMMQNSPRPPKTDEWNAPPRPFNPDTSSRPSSYVQPPRPSADPFNPNTNGYPSAVRQRI